MFIRFATFSVLLFGVCSSIAADHSTIVRGLIKLASAEGKAVAESTADFKELHETAANWALTYSEDEQISAIRALTDYLFFANSVNSIGMNSIIFSHVDIDSNSEVSAYLLAISRLRPRMNSNEKLVTLLKLNNLMGIFQAKPGAQSLYKYARTTRLNFYLFNSIEIFCSRISSKKIVSK